MVVPHNLVIIRVSMGEGCMSGRALGELVAMTRYPTTVCFRRMPALLERLVPALPPAIAVTGSKGKGSVSVMTDALLRSAGFRTVRHNSPHFLTPSERIALNGIPVSPERFEELLSRVLCVSNEISKRYDEDFGRFEMLFATAVLLASEERVDCMVLEGGVGGRYDSTSIVQSKLFAVTSVESEHAHIIGPSLDQIVCDKLDIGANESVAVVGKIDQALLARASHYAARRNVTIIRALERFPLQEYEEDKDGPLTRVSSLTAGSTSLRLPLSGAFQVSNAAVSLALAEQFVGNARPAGERVCWIARANAVWRGLSWPGRLEVVCNDPRIVVDAAHTVDSVKGITETLLKCRPERRVLLLGIAEGRDWQTMASILAQLRAPAIVSAPTRDYVDPNEVAASFANAGGDVLAVEPDLELALRRGIEAAKSTSATLYVLSGIFLGADVVRILRGLPRGEAVYL